MPHSLYSALEFDAGESVIINNVNNYIRTVIKCPYVQSYDKPACETTRSNRLILSTLVHNEIKTKRGILPVIFRVID